MAAAPLPFSPQNFAQGSPLPLEALTPEQRTTLGSAFGDGDGVPRYQVAPTNQKELQALINQCQANHWSLLPCGHGSKLTWGGLGKPASLLVSSRNLNRIIDHAVADLTVTVEAGITLQELQSVLEPHQQFLPLNPLYGDRATVGGIMATGCAGPWQQRYGGVRDLILGFSFVRWDGQDAKAGGRVVKNVAGYDLMKLFVGSHGTLGFISQITFRLYPLPPDSQTIVLTGAPENLTTAVQTLRRSGLAPAAALLVSDPCSQTLGLEEQMGLLVRFQNLAPVVQAQMEQMGQLASSVNLAHRQFSGTEETTLWRELNAALENPAGEKSILCKFGLLPAQGVKFLDQIPGMAQMQIGTGLGYARFNALSWTELKQQRQICQSHRGYLTLLEADADYKKAGDVWGHSGHGLALMGKIKQQFDPKNIFSPGRLLC